MYWGAGMTQGEIGKALCVSNSAISRAMHKYDIPTRGKGHIPTFSTRTDGYESWSLYDDGKTHTVYVHQLLAVSEGADPNDVFANDDYEIHHKNGVKWDNRSANIELLTTSEHRTLHAERGDIGPEKEFSDEELCEWIDAFVDYFGIVPTAEDLEGWPGPHPMTYTNRFGSWTEAIKQAGHTPRSQE
jgi:hypothetical protein